MLNQCRDKTDVGSRDMLIDLLKDKRKHEHAYLSWISWIRPRGGIFISISMLCIFDRTKYFLLQVFGNCGLCSHMEHACSNMAEFCSLDQIWFEQMCYSRVCSYFRTYSSTIVLSTSRWLSVFRVYTCVDRKINSKLSISHSNVPAENTGDAATRNLRGALLHLQEGCS